MSEIVLELSLARASGVLAGVVASLAQAGIELKTQKIERSEEGRGGWLIITGEGNPPESSVLAERLNNTRGVERLTRMVVDGQTVLADGNPVVDTIEETIEDSIGPEELAEPSAGSGIEPDREESVESPDRGARSPDDDTENPSANTAPDGEAAPPPGPGNSAEDDLATALADDAGDSPVIEQSGDGREIPALHQHSDHDREKAALRRLRRRRR